MASNNATKATQTDKKEKDNSHETEKDVTIKCLDGIEGKMTKFCEMDKAFIIELQLEGKTFRGCLVEASESFAPVKIQPIKRRSLPAKKPTRTDLSDNEKVQAKNKNFSKTNFPHAYVDASNTVESRLRFGRDNRSRTLLCKGIENSFSRSQKSDILTECNTKKKSHSVKDSKTSTSDENSHLPLTTKFTTNDDKKKFKKQEY